jgi:hypothetical protein
MATFSDIALEIRQTAERARRWAEEGWPMTFGKRQRPVNTLADAQALEESFPYRSEAVSYWRRAQEAGGDAAVWGERAAAALDRGDLRDADDSLYFAVFLERPIRGNAPVWGPVYRKFKDRTNGGAK